MPGSYGMGRRPGQAQSTVGEKQSLVPLSPGAAGPTKQLRNTNEIAALYEAGRCLQEMGDARQARAQFEQVEQQHGDTRWGALAADRLAEMAQVSLPGH